MAHYNHPKIVFGSPMRSRLLAHNLSPAENWQERLNEHDRHIAKQHEYAKNHYDKTTYQLKPIQGRDPGSNFQNLGSDSHCSRQENKIENIFSSFHRADPYVETDTSSGSSEIERILRMYPLG
ncbi:unnamed protein product [Lepeophtheirus salmonis]|uniref:(salmon louse) hypothetical protein n=1 Tax=Lepeophtheirus salmonis TaxID=72036 RepID=A0A7R8CRR4_LEPSM|nr:unnamed protein product [Lepeophtheirus salmonis]CAF2905340.1 unnamed protein product [Lepeophtheirus salmonis]